MTIGDVEDLRAMRFEDVQLFFKTYYHPSNASLAIAGDLAVEQAFDLAERYFGEIPPGVRPDPVRAVATALTGERRLVLEDRVEMPRLYMAWHSPAIYADGDADLDLFGDILTSGKMSRLYRTLVYERRLALDVSSFQASRELGGVFVLVVTGGPGRALADIVAVVDTEIQRAQREGPDQAEMDRVKAQAEAHFLYRVQTVGGFGGKSDQLNAYNVFKNDPGYFSADLERYRIATADSVRDAAARHLRLDRRILLSAVPRGQVGLALPGSSPVSVT